MKIYVPRGSQRNDLLFLKGPNPPKQGPNFNQNKGHLGSRYIYIYILYIYVISLVGNPKLNLHLLVLTVWGI